MIFEDTEQFQIYFASKDTKKARGGQTMGAKSRPTPLRVYSRVVSVCGIAYDAKGATFRNNFA